MAWEKALGRKEKGKEKYTYIAKKKKRKKKRVCRWHNLAGLGSCRSVLGCWAHGKRDRRAALLLARER